MNRLAIRTFADLMAGRPSLTISCAYSGQEVRRLETLGDEVKIVPASGPPVTVPASSTVLFEPWVMDRGSILFRNPENLGQLLKLCGEDDRVKYSDGLVVLVATAPDVEQAPHEVRVNFHG